MGTLFVIFICIVIVLYLINKFRDTTVKGLEIQPVKHISPPPIHNRESEKTTNTLEDSQQTIDAWEGTFRDGFNNYPVYALLQIEYTDSHGTKTKRIVEAREADNFLNNGMMMCFCRLRNATRTFIYSRVNSCVDVETGEVVYNLGEYLYNKYLSSPEYAVSQFESENTDLVKCLLYIGKSDGQLRKEEIAIITETCMKLSKNDYITENAVSALLSSLAVPSMQTFKLAVGRISTSGKTSHITALFRACEKIIGTQKTVHANEQSAIDYINKKYSKLGIDITKQPYCGSF